MFDVLANSAEIVAGVLGIAVTVVAIIVELAATRYNHRITDMFVRDPLNVFVLACFVATTVLCVWVPAVSDPAGSWLHPLTMGMISLSLLALLPYFGYVFSFISPISVIRRISATAAESINRCARDFDPAERRAAARSIDEIHDVMRSAIESGDRDIAMFCVGALTDIISGYQRQRQRLPDTWFEVDATWSDPDFVSLEPSALDRISTSRLWFEYKIFSQMYAALGLCIPKLRNVANLISIKTRTVAVEIAAPGGPLLTLCLTSFNSYLRTSLNARDPRTTYYFLSQYRLIAEALAARNDRENVGVIAQRIHFYGQLAFDSGQPFILEVCAFDLMQLIDFCVESNLDMLDDLLAALLELDREIRSDTQEESLLGVRRAQVQTATILLASGDSERADRVIEDIATETPARIAGVIEQLRTETQSQYWELTPRGVNFGYLSPERRPYLTMLEDRLRLHLARDALPGA